MLVEIEERILTYNRSQLEAWKAGDKRLVPAFLSERDIIINQPEYHFGEIFVLRHYHETEGWKGFISYAIGTQYPGSGSRARGRAKIEALVPSEKLTRFRALRAGTNDGKLGKGEPDLFLYRDSEECKFVEVKKETDRISQAQLRCMAQIMAILEYPVELVYLCEEGRDHKPRTYVLDLDRFVGQKKGLAT